MLNLLIKLNIFEILVNIDCKNISAVFENDIGLLVYMIIFSFRSSSEIISLSLVAAFPSPFKLTKTALNVSFDF